MNSGRILVAGGSIPHRAELRTALEFEGYTVAEAESIPQILDETASAKYDALVLDSAFRDAEAHEICRSIRLGSDLGLLVIERGGARDLMAIDCLNAGADDYVPGPFVLAELMARVRAILRRVPPRASRKIALLDRSVDLRAHKIIGPGNRTIHLTPKESQVLALLVSNANKSLTHQSLAQAVWQRGADGEFEYVRVVIKQLRRKLEPDPENPRYIHTERAVGYRFEMPAA